MSFVTELRQAASAVRLYASPAAAEAASAASGSFMALSISRGFPEHPERHATIRETFKDDALYAEKVLRRELGVDQE
jgi:hypothetical protein